MIVCLYVDDFVITGILAMVIIFKTQLLRKFNAKDLGEAKYVLGIEIIQSQNNISITQASYITNVINSLGLSSANSTQVPASGGDVKKASLAQDEPMTSSTPYREIVGKLMYAMVGTRPDITFAVGWLGQFSFNPTELNLQTAKKTVHYLIGTNKAKISYLQAGKSLKLKIFVDSDWGGGEDRKSTTGYIALINGAPVSWQSKRQPTVALSSTEAEYMAATQAAKEAIWLRRLLSDLGHNQNSPTVILKDNNGCIELAKNPIHHAHTKHIDI